MNANSKFTIALPKGRILDVVLPILSNVGIEPEASFFDKEKKLFIATFSRYCWEKDDAQTNKEDQLYYRVVCGLQIKNVSAINYKKYSTDVPFLNLLAITHKEKRIFLHFSKSIEIILNCEKMSVLIEDIDVPWPTKLKPKHDIE